MARFCVLCLALLSLWVYSTRALDSDLVLGIGDKCDTNSTDLNLINTITSDQNKSSNFPFPLGGLCDPLIPLECVGERCQCKRGFTLSRNGTKCLEVGRNGLESSCEESIQCWKSLLGRLSECNVSIGKCQCYESDTLHIVFHQGRCYYGEGLGDFCQIEGLCSATTLNANCRSGTCQCKEGYVPSWDKSRCILIATQGINSSCEENVQCEKSPLGTLSECNQETMLCQCYTIPMVPTVFHQGRCYFGAALGDVCQVSSQCEAKTDESLCGRDGKCHCKDGYVANANLTTCLPIAAPADGTEAECVEDIQCTKVLGHFSRCNLSKQKCECFLPSETQSYLNRSLTENALSLDNNNNYLNNNETNFIDSETTSMVIVGSKCYSAKSLGQSCKFNRQCTAVTENSSCYNGMCECEEKSFVTSQDGRKCLEIAKKGFNSPCDEDRQCQQSILGPLSQCSASLKKCECSNILPVVYYEKKCYFQRQLGASCESHSECKAGSNFYAECIQGRCQCQQGTQRLTDHSCLPLISSKATHLASCHGNIPSLFYFVIILSIFKTYNHLLSYL